MANVNNVTIAGQIGSEVEIKYTGAGKAYLKLSVATSNSWVDKSTGKAQEVVSWHNVDYWKHAHVESLVNQMKLSKGDSVLVVGEIEYSSYPINKTKDGVDLPAEISIPTTTIKASSVQFLTHPKAKNQVNSNAPANKDDSAK